MATVYIPALLHGLTGGRAEFDIAGETVREVLDNLERACPGLRERLLVPHVSIAIDGEITPLGLQEKVAPGSEIHFVVAVRGGTPSKNRL